MTDLNQYDTELGIKIPLSELYSFTHLTNSLSIHYVSGTVKVLEIHQKQKKQGPCFGGVDKLAEEYRQKTRKP